MIILIIHLQCVSTSCAVIFTNDTLGFIVGFIVGLIVGLIIGLMV